MTLLDPFGEPIQVALVVVETEGGPGRGGQPQAIHQRLCAVMTRADRDALTVEDRPHVVGMDSLDDEGEHSGLLPRRSDQPDLGDP